MPLFGQILAALYQEDVVEEDDIRAWHKLPIAQGEERKPGPETENFQKCLTIGAHMIRQFDEQESDSAEDESEDEVPVPSKFKEAQETTEESESDGDDDKSSGGEKDSTEGDEDSQSEEGSEDSNE